MHEISLFCHWFWYIRFPKDKSVNVKFYTHFSEQKQSLHPMFYKFIFRAMNHIASTVTRLIQKSRGRILCSKLNYWWFCLVTLFSLIKYQMNSYYESYWMECVRHAKWKYQILILVWFRTIVTDNKKTK